MDGFKIKLTQSLQYKLSIWLCVVIIAMAIAGGTLSFATAFEEANEMQDDQLKQVAALIHGHIVPLTMQAKPLNASELDADPEFRIVVQILSPSGIEVLAANQPPLILPISVLDGIQTLTLRDEAWRMFIKTLNSQQRIVVAQKIEIRDEVARESAIATLIPFVILIPVLLLVVSYLIREMFKPVTKLAVDLDLRSEQDIRTMDEKNLPSEILPFVVAINRMLIRADQSVLQQQRFIADAAHEMRTPITALSLQAERLESAEMSVSARERLSKLRAGLERTRLLLNQLLSLARAQQPSNSEKSEVSMQHIFRRVLEDMLPFAEVKHIDVGVVGEVDVQLLVQEFDLTVLIKNIVDNAIRYTPEGGRIDLSITSETDKVIIQIDDTGPGIPDEELERVFDPFYRVRGNDESGSGLGLSIVKTIADRLGAEITLANSNAANHSGLRVRVSMPI